ncbi:MAG: right-handed parallel beta-helix repeat-containing protein, partial [Opitutaceae bacterium]|nr:right-handed parallel beta-helix repeat-containing protein [Opitutaceae bacterium]
ADDGSGKPVTWRPEFAGKQRFLFEILGNANYIIDGRGTMIDATTPLMRGTVAKYYENAGYTSDGGAPVLREAEYNPPKVALHAYQRGTTSGEGTFIRNLTLLGFNRAFETHHGHRRRITMENCVLGRSSIGVFPRGRNGTVRNCVIRESLNCGVYGEYNSGGWLFENCVFSDNSVNAHAHSYGDIVLDACYEYTIRNNTFTRPSVPERRVPKHRTAISIFRNSGEGGDIRGHAAHHIDIRNNRFEAYHLAVDIGARSGVVDVKDRSLEGRCYTHDITVRENTFDECRIGIKINTDQNHIADNVFAKCDRDIVVHCVFYKVLNEHIIQNTAGADVWLWTHASDTRGFGDYCSYQSNTNTCAYSKISDRDRIFHLVTRGNVTLHPPSRGSFKAAVMRGETLAGGPTFRQMEASGATPVDVAVADYVAHLPGDEIAVIWDRPVSNVEGKDFYTIIIYDQRGVELDRCGRSPVRWKAIAGGNMIPGKGWIHVNAEAEIAAVAGGPDAAGKYPVFIFRRGFGLDIKNLKDAGVWRLATENTRPWHDVATGDFIPGGPYLEVAVIPAPAAAGEAQKIYYFDPGRPDWAGGTDALPAPLNAITAGNFDPAAPGDEVAGIGAAGENATPIFLFRPGSHGAYRTVPGSEGRWAAVAGGEFDGNAANGDELAAAAAGREGEDGFPLKYFRAGTGLYDARTNPALNAPARALDAGRAIAEYKTGGAVEKAAAAAPREEAAFLPARAQEDGIPLLWISPAQSPGGADVRATPLYR